MLRYKPLESMKYGPFLKIRSLSSFDSKWKVKYPFPQKWMEILPCILSNQFCSIHLCALFGEGQRPVNCPMRPRSANERVAMRGRAGGRITSCRTSSFFNNLEIAGRGRCGGKDFTRVVKACWAAAASGVASRGAMAKGGGRKSRFRFSNGVT